MLIVLYAIWSIIFQVHDRIERSHKHILVHPNQELGDFTLYHLIRYFIRFLIIAFARGYL